jgi:peptidoglycan/xylan/chitin deacetylase (PgdA/CDA1 family)
MKRFSLSLLVVALVLVLSGSREAGAQAVQQLVNFQQPSRSVAMDIQPFLADPKKPRVALFRSIQTDRYMTSDTVMVDNAVYYWELLLLGLRIPFKMIDEQDLGGGIDNDFHVVIMPATEALSSRQKRRIRDFVRDGGGLIASGRFGMFDEEGNSAEDAFFSELFGADAVVAPRAQPFGFLQSIDGNTPLSNGIPVGYHMNIAAQQPLVLARPRQGERVGRFITYDPKDQASFDSLSTVIYNESGNGRAVWMRFNPQDISREREQQENYQRFVVNAIGLLARTTSISFAPWPEARPMAFSVAAMAAAGFDPLTYMEGLEQMLDILETQQVPGSFFLASEEVRAFQDLMIRMNQLGEIGLTTENDYVLMGQPMEVQRDRILTSRQQLGVQEIHGIYPPAGFFDGNTIRAMEEIDADYLLLPSQPSLVPGVIDWWASVDYRETLTLEDLLPPEEEEMPLFVPGEENVPSAPMTREQVKQLPDPLSIIPVTEGIAPSFQQSYNVVRDAHGYYVLPYYPETYAARSRQASDMEATIARAKREGAWIVTTSQALTWWRARGQVRPVIASMGRDEMQIDLINDSERPLSGLVMEIRGREGQYRHMRISGGEGETLYIEELDVTLVYLPTLDIGGNRITLTWRR